MRRPFSNTSVDDTPKPRKFAPEKPLLRCVSVFCCFSSMEPTFAASWLSNCSAVVAPLLAMSSRVST